MFLGNRQLAFAPPFANNLQERAENIVHQPARRKRRDSDHQRLFALVHAGCLYGAKNALQKHARGLVSTRVAKQFSEFAVRESGEPPDGVPAVSRFTQAAKPYDIVRAVTSAAGAVARRNHDPVTPLPGAQGFHPQPGRLRDSLD